MPRIRSIQHGFFTDERLVTCTPFARLLFIGLWIEADDQGVFEWKPVTIKIRLMPVDAVDISALLSELTAVDAIGRFSDGGREYGAIRNFCKFQRPKSPTASFPLPGDWGNYVCLSARTSETTRDERDPVPKRPPGKKRPIPRNGEKAPQSRVGEGRKSPSQEGENPSQGVEPQGLATHGQACANGQAADDGGGP